MADASREESGKDGMPPSVIQPATEGHSSLFPLELTAFEEYMFTDDRPSQPMMIVLVSEVTGDLRESEFREAAGELFEAHPLLRCIVGRISGRLHWIPVPCADNIVEWVELPAQEFRSLVPDLRRRDLRQQTGCCLRVLHSTSGSRIFLEVHHACCDGLAAVHLVAELFARYGVKTAAEGGKAPEFEPPGIDLLCQRDQFRPPSAKQKRSRGELAAKIWRLVSRRPLKLLGSLQRSSTRAQPFVAHQKAFWLQTLPPAELQRLHQCAARQHVSINDLLLQQAFLQVRDWNSDGGQQRPQGWIRIAVPLSMRQSQHSGIPACNMVSYGLVTHQAEEADDPATLLQNIQAKTSTFLRSAEGRIALRIFSVLRRIPFGMRVFLSHSSGSGTIVITTVGDVSRRLRCSFPLTDGKWIAGNVVVESFGGAPPVRKGTSVAITVAEYAGELTVGLRSDGAVISEADSQAFLTEFMGRLRAVAAAQATSSSGS